MDAPGLHAGVDEASSQHTVTEQLCQSVAHDLRGVLMAIQLSAEELSVSGSAVLELQSEIQAAVERATRLVEELTALARPAGGYSEVFDVGPLLDQMQRMLRRNARPGTIVNLELATERCFVAAPRVAFKRVLLTLFNSAVSRLPPGSTLNIETAVVDDARAGEPANVRGRVVVSLGHGAYRASDWAGAERVATDALENQRRAAGSSSEALSALVQGWDAELYCLGSPETSSQFWLSLPQANVTPAGG